MFSGTFVSDTDGTFEVILSVKPAKTPIFPIHSFQAQVFAWNESASSNH
jgi:hypothetical protein